MALHTRYAMLVCATAGYPSFVTPPQSPRGSSVTIDSQSQDQDQDHQKRVCKMSAVQSSPVQGHQRQGQVILQDGRPLEERGGEGRGGEVYSSHLSIEDLDLFN